MSLPSNRDGTKLTSPAGATRKKSGRRWIRRIAIDSVIIFIAFTALWFVLPQFVIQEIVVFSLVVLAFDLLYGYMGYLSFGHALYFGVGAYSTALFLTKVNSDPLLAIGASVLIGLATGALAGPLALRQGGAYFALICMAFNAVGFYLFQNPLSPYTHGEDGISFVVKPLPFLNLGDPVTIFFFSLVALCVVFFVLRIGLKSQYGMMVKAVKMNETKLSFIGFSTFRTKYVTFMASAMLAAFAGSLYALSATFVGLTQMDPLLSGYIVVMGMIGGPGSLFGALIGSGIFIFLQDFLSGYLASWDLVAGAILLVLLLVVRGGIWSGLLRLQRVVKGLISR